MNKNEIISCDLVVVGAGFAGICIAVAAARQGVRVALINDRNVPGGNVSSEHRVSIGGAASGGSFYAREAGIADEIKTTIFHNIDGFVYKNDYHLLDMTLLQFIINEKNIMYFPGTSIYDCECLGGFIKKAFGFKTNTQQYFEFCAPYFCDSSGDGILGIKAGAEFRVGREGKYEFNESLAPENPDSHVMGSCILFSYKHENRPVPFKKPDFAYDFVNDGIIKFFDRAPSERRLPDRKGPYNSTWWIEYGGMEDTVTDSDDIDFELKKLIYSYWDYIKNSGNYPEAYDCSIEWIAPYASKRESRRFVGEYIMNQNDIEQARNFEDAVSIGGWCLDIHDVEGIYGSGQPSAYGDTPSMYNIPYRIMYSKNIHNLFFGGRLVSCTHVALGSLRVNETLGAMGHAVGLAAALCKKYSCTPSEISKKHIKELQNALQKDGQFILDLKEDCGLAQQAVITASSSKRFENANTKYKISLSDGVTLTLPILDTKLNAVDIYIKNETKESVRCDYRIFGEHRIKDHHYGDMIYNSNIIINPEFEGFITFGFDICNCADNKVFLHIDCNDKLSVLCSDNRITGAPCFDKNNRMLTDCNEIRTICFKITDDKISRQYYCSNNIVNGYSRPYRAADCWVSESKEDEWINLDFKEPVDITEIQLYFNGEFETDQFKGYISQLITDYEIVIKTDVGIIVKSVTDNYLIKNRVAVSAKSVNEIRVNFKSNNGAPNFELFAIKVF